MGLAGNSLILTLIYSAVVLWVLGLALPITVTAIIAAVAAVVIFQTLTKPVPQTQ